MEFNRMLDGKLQTNEEEVAAIRVIFDQYVHTDIGANGVEKYLENHGIYHNTIAEREKSSF